MECQEVFYNREDPWQIPSKLTDLDESTEASMAPYYITMRLPGAESLKMYRSSPRERFSAGDDP